MSIVRLDDLSIHAVPRIKTHVHAGVNSGATETAVWEQWIEPDGYIPLHYHDVEEVLVFLEGEIALTLSEETTIIQAPATVVIPAEQVHGLCPVGSTSIHLLVFFPTSSPKIIAAIVSPAPWDPGIHSSGVA